MLAKLHSDGEKIWQESESLTLRLAIVYGSKRNLLELSNILFLLAKYGLQLTHDRYVVESISSCPGLEIVLSGIEAENVVSYLGEISETLDGYVEEAVFLPAIPQRELNIHFGHGLSLVEREHD